VGTTIHIAGLVLTFASLLLAQSSGVEDVPVVTTFVAPAYPWAAKEQRIMGKTLTLITVNRDGAVTQAKTISAHPVFAEYVLDALKQWHFKPSRQERTLQITCLFELTTDKCQATDKITSETHVSAELPTVVRIRTGLQCVDITVGHERH